MFAQVGLAKAARIAMGLENVESDRTSFKGIMQLKFEHTSVWIQLLFLLPVSLKYVAHIKSSEIGLIFQIIHTYLFFSCLVKGWKTKKESDLYKCTNL